MPFEKLDAFTKKVADLPDSPSGNMTPADIKQFFDSAPEELRVKLNKLIEDLSNNAADWTYNEGDHKGSWQGLTPEMIGAPEMNSARISAAENEIAVLNDSKADQSYVYDKLPVFTQWKDRVFGQEQLIAFQKKLGSGNPVKVLFSGDSTTEGYGLAAPSLWKVDRAFERMARKKGFENVTAINKGHSSMCTEHWNRTYCLEDMNDNPDLIILRWGINDPAYDNQLNHLADDGKNYNLRRNAKDFEASLRSGLSKIRSQRNNASLSILLMTPNSTSDDASFRNEKWHEEINAVIRRAAREFQCAFLDTYRMFQDSRNAQPYMDIINAGHIHPFDFMNLWITDITYKTVVPDIMHNEYGLFNKPAGLTLQNGWVVYDSSKFDYPEVSKHTESLVSVRGLIKAGKTDLFTIISTVPAYAIPAKSKFFVIASETGVATIKLEAGTGNIQVVKANAGEWIDMQFTYTL